MESRIRRVVIEGVDYDACARHARIAELGGTSHVRGEADRASQLSVDQLVGQLGTMAVTFLLTGSTALYLQERTERDKDRWKGDGGSDVPGARIDIKTSLRRNRRNSASTYNLLVRPAELHDNWVYVLAVVMDLDHKARTALVEVVGWASSYDLPKNVEDRGEFKGAYRIRGRDLRSTDDLILHYKHGTFDQEQSEGDQDG